MTIKVHSVCVLLQVFDMPASVRFYRDVLGFEVVQTSPREGDQFDWGWLRLNDADIMLNTAYEQEYRPSQPDATLMAAHGDTCLYFSCPDVDGAYQHLLSHGVKVEEPKVAPYGMKQLYLKDPDGYSLCFQSAADPVPTDSTPADQQTTS